MPITVTPSGPGALIGPGLTLSLHSDFVGPLQADSRFEVQLYVPPPSETQVQVGELPTVSTTRVVQWLSSHNDGYQLNPYAFHTGDQVLVQAKLYDGQSTLVDSGETTATWDETAGLSLQAFALKTTSTGGGLTPEQGQQLKEVHDATALQKLMNTLLLVEVSAGPTGDPVNANLPFAVFGVIIRIATVPADIGPGTPDGGYWTPSLAVVRVYRGSDMWLRVPVHTESKLIPFWTENLFVGITAVTLTEWLLQMTVQVTFRAGVTGQVFLMTTP